MTTLRFDPFRDFEKIMGKVNEFAKDFEKGVTIEHGGFAPRADIFEDDKNLYFEIELAGVAKDTVTVKVNEDRMLIVSGEKKKCEPEGRVSIRCERSFGEFSRSFVLPETADLDNIKAQFKDGILELTVSKKEPEGPKEFHINIE